MNFLTSPIFAAILQSRNPSPVLTNWALASGTTATASAAYSPSSSADKAINGDRTTNNSYINNIYVSSHAPTAEDPIFHEVEFTSAKNVSEIDVFGMMESVNYSTQPTLTDTNPTWKLIDFELFYWNGSAYVSIASVTGNDKVWRQFIFAPITTTKIRLEITQIAVGSVYLAEFEIWGT